MQAATTCPRPRWIIAMTIVVVAGAWASAHAVDPWARLHDEWRWVELGTGLPSGRINDIVETADGVSWAGTNGGLAYFDGFRWRPAGPKRRGDNPDQLVPDNDGGLLLVRDGRLYRGNRDGFDPVPVREEGEDLVVSSVACRDDGALLVLASGRLLVEEASGLSEFPVPPLRPGEMWCDLHAAGERVWLTCTDATYEWADDAWQRRLGFRANLMVRDGDAVLLASTTGSHGVWRSSPGALVERLAMDEPTWVYSMDVDDHGTAVIAHTSGLVRFRTDGVWHSLAHRPPPMTHTTLVRFRSDGNLWIDTARGLMLFRAAAERWTRWHEPEDPLPNVVNALLRRHDGSLWAGTNAGLFVREPGGASRVIDRVGDVPIPVVTGLAEDSSGRIYVSSGSHFDGVYRWDGVAWRHFGAEDGLGVRHVHVIESDGSGRLWFLGLADDDGEDPGPFLVDGDRFRRWSDDARLPARRVYAFRQDVGGAYWFGTNRGVSRWHEGRWSHWTPEKGLARPRVYVIEIDLGGRVWFGHRFGTAGLGSIDANGSVSYLPVGGVRDLATGTNGALWISTQTGLVRYADGRLSTFGSATGLEHARLWPIIALDRTILVGTQGGGVYGLDLEEAGHAAPLVDIASPVLGADGALFRWSVFPYDGEMAPRDVMTRYRFDDGPWSAWSTARETTASGISSGDRRFMIEASNLFGTHTARADVAFHVAPPFFRHPAFLAAAFAWVVATLAVVAVYWRRRRRDQALLRAREHHFRMLIENASDLITVVDERGIVQYQSPSATRLMGRGPDEIVGCRIMDLVRPGRPSRRGAAARTSLRGPAWSRVVRVRHADGTWRVLEAFGRRVQEADSAAFTIINSRDITARLAAEEEIRNQSISERLLRQELDHRVRNNLSSLLALIDLGRASTDEVDVFARRIRDRTHTIALVHTLLSRRKWRAVGIAELITALLPHDTQGRVDLDGPSRMVAASRCQAVALVVNELMTNSLKHGALGRAGGRVEVRWRTLPQDDDRIEIAWRESGGPPVAVEVKPGVGATLIRGLVQRELRGTIVERYEPTGVRHAMTFSLGTPEGAETASFGERRSL